MTMISTHQSLVSSTTILRSFSQVSGQGGNAAREPSQALSTLQNKALNALAREIPGMESTDLKSLDPAQYTPEKIAERIGQAVAMGLENARAQGKSEEEIQALYESAIKGVEQGFKEAREVLSNLNVLSGSIAEQVDATEKVTFETLAKLSPSQRAQDTQDAQSIQSASETKSLGIAQRYQSAENMELTLKTRDGDTVRVSFSRDLDAEGRFGMSEDGEGNRAAVLDVSRSESTGYSFSVEGDLSVEEIDAIQNLVRDVGKVANDFFGGDVQKAFEEVSDVSFDSRQLASMNLQMSRSQQYSAAKVYQETQRLEQPEQAKSEQRLGHLMRELRESFETPALDFLDQVNQAAGQILQGLVQQDSRYLEADVDRQSIYEDNLQRLLSSIEGEVKA